MLKSTLVLLVALLPLSLFSQTLEWSNQAGGTNFDVGSALEFDAAGNIFSTGLFRRTVDFDPGPGVFNLIAPGSYPNVFVQKLDTAGNFIWAKSIGGNGHDVAYDIAIDPLGNIYLTGMFQESADFDPGPGVHTLYSQGYFDAFVCKLDSAGNLIWARSMGNGSEEQGRSIAVDNSGNVYTAGMFEFDVDFNPGLADADTFTLQGSFNDVFIQKLDADGNFLWARRFGELYNDNVTDLKITPDGQILVFGHVTGTPKYGTIAATDSITVNGTDPFLLRIDPDGQLVWAKHFGGPLLDQAFFMQLDADGNIYTGGSFAGTADLDPGPGLFEFSTPAWTRGNFLQKLDPDGNFLWAMQYATGVSPAGLEIDADDNLILMGTLQGTADLDPGPAVQYFTALGDYDYFVQKLDTDREQVWVQVSGGPNTEGFSDLRIDTSGAIFLIGGFRDSIDVNPAPESTILKSKGLDDIFLLKWQQGLDFNGRVFHDLNNNQAFDPGEPPLPNIVLAVPDVGRYTSTNNLGKFRFNAEVTGDTLVAIMPRTFWTATPAYYVPDSSQTPMDFAVHIQPGLQDISVSAIAVTPFQPGRETEILIQVRNNGSARADSVLVTFSFKEQSDWVTLVDAEPAPLAVLGDSLVWQIDSLEIDSLTILKLTLKTSASAVPGATVTYRAEALQTGDIYPQDNRFEVETLIVGSYDPNDKQVSPDLFSPVLLDSIKLRYLIRFQNTGNFPATQVLLLDTLSESLDLATLKVIGASHPCTWRLRSGRILEFLFADIALPDSISNEPGSHGFAAFTIQPRRDLSQGDSVHNRAAIYFDFNAPVLTNQAVTAVDRDQDGDGFFSQEDCDDLAPSVYPGAPDLPGNGIDEDCDGQDATVALRETFPLPSLSIWPNPAHNQVLVGFGAPETGILEIWTATGQLLLQQRIKGQGSCTLAAGDYPRGGCILRFSSDDGRVMMGRVVLD